MLAILKKEFNSFFASSMGYLVIGLFLILNGLFLWVFPGQYNILDGGFASLESFFALAPWIFLFLIPAITMKTFSEEIRQGTLELLLTKPVKTFHLILGKYLGAFALVLLALLPTLLYVLAVNSLSKPSESVDFAVILGSYLGLIFLAGCYIAMGIFASMFSRNQIVAFLLALFLCFLFYYSFEALASLQVFKNGLFEPEAFGIHEHYKSISRGVVDTRDVVYFLSFIAFFLALTNMNLQSKRFS